MNVCPECGYDNFNKIAPKKCNNCNHVFEKDVIISIGDLRKLVRDWSCERDVAKIIVDKLEELENKINKIEGILDSLKYD